MIRVNTNQRTVRETNCEWEYQDGDEWKSDSIRVRYFSPSTEDLEKQRAEYQKMNDDGKIDFPLASVIFPQIHSLPDLVDDKDKPIKITLEFLKKQTIVNLDAIREAINEHVSPKITADQLADWYGSFDNKTPATWGKRGIPPPGNAILILAEKYSQLPEAIEKQEPIWLNRMLLKLEGESAHDRRSRISDINQRRGK